MDLGFCQLSWFLTLLGAVNGDLDGARTGIDGKDDFGHSRGIPSN